MQSPPARDERPSMVGLPPTALTKKEVKTPGKRGRKPKGRQAESESEMDLGVDDSNPSTPAAGDTVNEDDVTMSPPMKKRRGRPPEPNSASARLRRERERRRKEKEQKAQKRQAKLEAKEQQPKKDEVEEEEEETTEQDQERDVTEEAESETESEAAVPEPEPEIRGYSKFQLFCNHILRKLMEKDPEEYFTYPVSPLVAPDYFQVITKPMDFCTIKRKIGNNEYTKLEDMKNDVILICENAQQYNNPHTTYYMASQKLQHVANYYFGEDFLEYLRYHLPFGKYVERELLGLPEKDILPRPQRVATEARPIFQQKQMESPLAQKLLADAPPSLKKKLTTEVPKWPLGYIDNQEGAVALNLVTSTEPTKIPLGDLVGKLEAGHPGLLGEFEDAFPALVPSSYLSYEPFASFAPIYDTTWATMNQRDSDMLTQTYGDRENAADVMQLRKMVGDSGGYFLELVDNMLDTLTDGEHTRTIEALSVTEEESNKMLEQAAAQPTTPDTFRKLLDDVSTLENIGLDTSFVKEIKADCNLTGVAPPEEEIVRNGYAINDFAYLQSQRLTRTITNLGDVPEISETEIELSARMATNFQQQIIQFQVVPNDLVSNQALHNGMGINDDDGCDYDVLREFVEDF